MVLENKLGRTQLEKVIEVIKSSDDELNSYTDFVLEVYKKEIIALIEKLRYSDDGYFFIRDYNSTLISHW